ncbi:MAG: FmdB family zinc ribbon protein [Acidimicrobiales bacterium]
MPTYEYACKSCGEHLEVVQSFKDDALTTCPACGGSLRKVFGSIGISFKGSGFYRTDSRGSGASKKESEAPAAAAKASPGSADTPAKKADAAAPSPSTGSRPAAKAAPKPAAAAG